MHSKAHPEGAADEFFVGNQLEREVPEYLKHLPTVRVGETAYEVTDYVEVPDRFPLFVGEQDHEAYDRIMVNRWRAIRGWGPDAV